MGPKISRTVRKQATQKPTLKSMSPQARPTMILSVLREFRE